MTLPEQVKFEICKGRGLSPLPCACTEALERELPPQDDGDFLPGGVVLEVAVF